MAWGTAKKPVIRMNEDGSFSKRYESIKDAARDNGGEKNDSLITRAIKRNIKHYGYYFAFADNTKKVPNKIDHPHVKKLPSVLVLDVETLPMKVFVWGLYKQRINHTNIIQDWQMASWAAKWLFDAEMMSDVLTPQEAINRDDSRIMKSLWNLVEKAEVIIAHNGIRFDIRRMNARFLANGLRRPSPYQVIDTLKHSQRNFAFASHRLDYLGKLIENKGKLETDFGLWIKCDAGDPESLKYMEAYNREDVLLLEDVYVELRGWITSHPNLALYCETDEKVCPTCMSEKLEPCGDYVTSASRFESMRCLNCGSIMRVRVNGLTIKEKNRLVLSVAR